MSKYDNHLSYVSLIILLFITSFYSYNTRVEGRDINSSVLIISSEPNLQEFRLALSNIVNQSNNLTATYQKEIGKWKSHEYDNSALARITDKYLPKFENLINQAQNLTYPTNHKYIHDALVNSLRSETDSNKYFRDYLLSGSETENEISIDLLSKAWEYEKIYSQFLAEPLPSNQMTSTNVKIIKNFLLDTRQNILERQ